MSFCFATCQVDRAIEFIAKMYPSQEVTTEKVSKLIPLFEKDILRVQDPDFHKPCQIIAGNNYDSKYSSEVEDAINQLKENLHNKENINENQK